MKQKVEVLFYLKKKEQDKDGKCPIMGRITVGKTIAAFSTKLKIDIELKPRTVSIHISTMRRMVSLAIGEGIISHDPFNGYAPPHAEKVHRYLNKQEVFLLMNTPLKKDLHKLIRDLFLIQIFTGLAWNS
ncbi:MAG: hypothetical protein LBL97_01630 [Prevotellaceae bacterium]|jgi:site-specific recombinase XerD|nr:hypothetical protein [Prevotellaceae bacterium]